MENINEIIINDASKVRKPLTEAQKEVKKESMKKYYLKKKSDPEYIERQRLSSKTHYYKHKEEVLERMKTYQQNKLKLARIEALHDLQQERAIDLMTGDCSQEDYDKLQQKINDLLAHMHLLS
jgi:predicted XRE-type DNA-binding protein